MNSETQPGNSDYKYFKKHFLEAPGAHLLGTGISGSGKTSKAVLISKGCLKAGKSIVWFDSGKGEEILFLLNFGYPATVFYPAVGKCSMKIEGSPVPIEYVPLESPEALFRQLRPGLNIVSIRPFFTELTPYVRYLSRAFNQLIDDAYRKMIKAVPLTIFLDEAQTIFPSRRIHESPRQQELGARIAMAVYTLRSEGIGLAAFSQSFRNIAPSVRAQFNFHLVGRNPDSDPKDFIGNLIHQYEPMLSKFGPDMALIIRPDGTFKDKVHFPLPKKPEGATVEYIGHIRVRKMKEEEYEAET